LKAEKEVIIESPFITSNRVKVLLPIFQQLVPKGINISIVTRYLEEHELNLRIQAEKEIHNLEEIGISIIFCAGIRLLLQIKLNLSQEELAAKAKVDLTSISEIETGLRNPSLKMIQKIASALGIKIKDLIDF